MHNGSIPATIAVILFLAGCLFAAISLWTMPANDGSWSHEPDPAAVADTQQREAARAERERQRLLCPFGC
jgi:hypothetical protein